MTVGPRPPQGKELRPHKSAGLTRGRGNGGVYCRFYDTCCFSIPVAVPVVVRSNRIRRTRGAKIKGAAELLKPNNKTLPRIGASKTPPVLGLAFPPFSFLLSLTAESLSSSEGQQTEKLPLHSSTHHPPKKEETPSIKGLQLAQHSHPERLHNNSPHSLLHRLLQMSFRIPLAYMSRCELSGSEGGFLLDGSGVTLGQGEHVLRRHANDSKSSQYSVLQRRNRRGERGK